jgi:hypothetical protein
VAAHLEKLALDAERSGNGLLFLDEEKLMRELETGTISDEELVDSHLTRPTRHVASTGKWNTLEPVERDYPHGPEMSFRREEIRAFMVEPQHQIILSLSL